MTGVLVVGEQTEGKLERISGEMLSAACNLGDDISLVFIGEVSDDLVQEAIVEAAKRNDGNTPDLPLVYATIRRRAIDLARSMDRRSAREKDVLAEKDPCWFDNTIEQKETALLVDQAMKKMPEKYREVVVLKIWSELTFAQIADTLEIPLNTAASRYRYGLEILKRDANLKQP